MYLTAYEKGRRWLLCIRKPASEFPAILKIILLLVVMLMAHGVATAQKINCSFRNQSLEQIFKEIKKQTGYLFLYDNAVLRKAVKVSIDVKDADLEKVLQLCFQEQPLQYTIVDRTILVKRKEDPVKEIERNEYITDNVGTISGTVVDEKVRPISGASITIVNSARGTVADHKGRFRLLNVPLDAMLQISSLGYVDQTVTIPTERAVENGLRVIPIQICMAIKQESMNAVVVTTAYGMERQLKQTGYSVSTVSGKELVQTTPVNLLTGLTGKVAGLSVSTLGGGTNEQIRVTLRGIRSLSGNNIPLFVLNGVQLSQGADQASMMSTLELINSINPADIEDVVVLKGANASTLYGPDGVNGVIIINTKKGRGKAQVNFQHSTSFQQVIQEWPRYQGGFGPGFAVNEFGDGIYDPLGNYQHWGAAYDGSMVDIGRPDESGDIQKVPYSLTKDRKQFWDLGMINQHNLSVSGGDAQSNVFMAIGRMENKGVIPGDRYSRNSFRLNAGRKYGRLLELAANLSFVNSISNNSVANVMAALQNTGGHIPLTRYRNYLTDKWSDRNHYYNDYFLNPYEELGTRRSRLASNTFIGNMEVVLRPLYWLQLTNRFGFSYNGSDAKTTSGALLFSDFAKNSGRMISFFDQSAQVSDLFSNYVGLTNDLLVTVSKQVKDIAVKVTIGSSLRENKMRNLSASAFSLIVPDLFNLRNNNGPLSAGEKSTMARTYSLLGSLQLGYRDLWFIEFTGRKDWDSKLARAARSKNFYGGANTAFVLSELWKESHLAKKIPGIRLTAAITRTANMNIGPYEIETSFYNAIGFPYGPVNGYTMNAFQANPDIRPEKVFSQEYGIELAFLQKRILLNTSWYIQKNDGQIMQVAMTPATGFLGTRINAGRFTNQGLEFDLRLNPLVRLPQGINIQASAQLAINSNKVLSLYGNQQSLPVSSVLAAVVGKPAFTYTLAGWKRDPQGRVIVDKQTGYPQVDPEPLVLGGSLPRYMASFSLQASWKWLSLHAVAEYRGGHYYYHGAAQMATVAGHDLLSATNNRQRFVFPNSVYEENGKFVENRSIVVQEAQSYLLGSMFSTASTNFYTSGAFWKLRELVLTCQVPVKSKWIRQLSVALTGRNLITLLPATNKWGDPEAGAGYNNTIANSNTAGAESDDYTLPGTRQFGFNLNVSF